MKLLSRFSATALFMCFAAPAAIAQPWTGVPEVAVDETNKAAFEQAEADWSTGATEAFNPAETYTKFDWFEWNFDIDPELDAVGQFGDGVGTIHFRLFTPEVAEAISYPLVMGLGGLGSTNSFADNGYARLAAFYASEAVQSEHPAYVLTFNIPFEAAVNHEAEMAYVFELGEIAKAVSKQYGNVDIDRIYATGVSQGAGWSYELASIQPDLLAGMLIDAGTTVHSTWGNQIDMQAVADSDVNIYILHGYKDQYIPVNEAYRTYNKLVSLGKSNLIMRITDDQHGVSNYPLWSSDEVTEPMEWLLSQRKSVPAAEQPAIIDDKTFADYRWAGVLALSGMPNWGTAIDYSTWTEPAENETWNALRSDVALDLADGSGGTGDWHLARVRIGDELQTTYDDALVPGALTDEDGPLDAIVVKPGDVLAVTVQGYTGTYGNDLKDFNSDWSVEWAVLKGDVSSIELTDAASPEPIVRPATVNLANGGGPNLNNSLYSWNAIDGRQVYLRIDVADEFEGEELEVAIRFTRALGDGEYASYLHVVKSALR